MLTPRRTYCGSCDDLAWPTGDGLRVCAADMRKGFDGLCALVTQGLQHNPLSGDVYLFVSRDRVRAKVLHWDGTGLCVFAKRLERGRFATVWRDHPEAPVTLTVSELQLFLDGSTLVGRVALAPPALTQFSLASDDQMRRT